jgi:hypothetical protein
VESSLRFIKSPQTRAPWPSHSCTEGVQTRLGFEDDRRALTTAHSVSVVVSDLVRSWKVPPEWHNSSSAVSANEDASESEACNQNRQAGAIAAAAMLRKMVDNVVETGSPFPGPKCIQPVDMQPRECLDIDSRTTILPVRHHLDKTAHPPMPSCLQHDSPLRSRKVEDAIKLQIPYKYSQQCRCYISFTHRIEDMQQRSSHRSRSDAIDTDTV